jgi:uncharacterized protein YprB with RNaseH-like and TPR domain
MDLSSRLRAIVKGGPPRTLRELTYEPDTGGYEAVMDVSRVGAILGGRPAETSFGQCLVIDRRYESDRFHGAIRIGECEVEDFASLAILDPSLATWGQTPAVPLRTSVQIHDVNRASDVPWGQTPDGELRASAVHIDDSAQCPDAQLRTRRTIFIDLETTGLSGGAGTVAFLVGCGYFDLGAFQVRQFLLTSFAAERALLAAVADFFDGADLIVTYNGKTFDVPVMETRWLFHRLQMPLGEVPHFDMLHPARRLWKTRAAMRPFDPSTGSGSSRAESRGDRLRVVPSEVEGRQARDTAPGTAEDSGCRLTTLERTLFNVTRVGEVAGFEIPGRFFRFLRSGDPRPLEAVLEHNRLDLVSLAAVMARALQLARDGEGACRDCAEALALGRVYERAGTDDRVQERAGALARAEACYARAAESGTAEVKGEALYRLALRCRRERRFEEAAAIWRQVLELTEPRAIRRIAGLAALRRFAAEALAIHHEHRERDPEGARELALFALSEADGQRIDGMRHRLARLDRKIAKKTDAQLFFS